jgi:hypothetical protein
VLGAIWPAEAAHVSAAECETGLGWVAYRPRARAVWKGYQRSGAVAGGDAKGGAADP